MGSTICLPCEICGRNDSFTVGGRCQICWILVRDLPAFLTTPGGLMFARKHMPLLDDWVGNKADAWDYEAVLKENNVNVFQDTVEDIGWYMSWQHGTMHFGIMPEIYARKASALFVSLWLRSVSASFANKLVSGYIMYLNFQEE